MCGLLYFFFISALGVGEKEGETDTWREGGYGARIHMAEFRHVVYKGVVLHISP